MVPVGSDQINKGKKMIYEFYCRPCNAIDEIERPVSEAKDPYTCPECGKLMKKQFSIPQIVTRGEDKLQFNPAFGKVMTNAQAKREAKEKGWTEIGSEDVSKIKDEPKRHNYDFNDYFT